MQAGKLPQKIEEYYYTEGMNDPIVIELPKGHFQLNFRRHRDEDYTRYHVVPERVLRKWRRICVALGATALLLAALAAYWRTDAVRQKEAGGWARPYLGAELDAIWRPYLESDRPVLICLGAPLFTKFSGAFVRNPKLNEWADALESPQMAGFKATLGSDYALPSHNFTGIGEATGAFLLAKFLLARGCEPALTRSNILSWEDVRNNNLIFLGSPKFNLQLESIPIPRDFIIEGGSLQNLRPRDGEQRSYGEVWSADKSAILEGYALITRLPGLHGRGEMTMLAASSTEGTWAAVEYVTQAPYAQDLVGRLRTPSGDLPRSYQVVIKAEFKTQVPLEISYVTQRQLAVE